MTVSDTSDTFLVATSVNFQPTSATLLVNFEAPKENADQLWKEKKGKEMNDIMKPCFVWKKRNGRKVLCVTILGRLTTELTGWQFS